jgi:hypothetical protein
MLVRRPFPYRQLLSEVHALAKVRLPTLLAAQLTALTRIDAVTLEAWERQWLPEMPPGEEWSDWNWKGGMARRRPKRHKRFEVAIWSDEHLCGLALGAPSLRRRNLTIRVVQGSPLANHPLKGKILPIVIELASMYGAALDCQELRFSNPLTGMIPVYERVGFRLVRERKGVVHCSRLLSIGGQS